MNKLLIEQFPIVLHRFQWSDLLDPAVLHTMPEHFTTGEVEEMKQMIKNKLDECQSDFEVSVLKENLQEEFGLYLNELEGE